MSSLDQETIRRAQNEIRNSVGNSNEGSGATWFLVVVAIVAIIGGIYVFSIDTSGASGATTGEPTPTVTEEIAPVAPPAE